MDALHTRLTRLASLTRPLEGEEDGYRRIQFWQRHTHGDLTATDAPSEEVLAESLKASVSNFERVPVSRNYLFCALAGTTWYFQFFYYAMGEVKMGKFNSASWTLHMAGIIIFSTMWGWILHEWKGASQKAHALTAGGIITLILSTIVIGWGTYLKSR